MIWRWRYPALPKLTRRYFMLGLSRKTPWERKGLTWNMGETLIGGEKFAVNGKEWGAMCGGKFA